MKTIFELIQEFHYKFNQRLSAHAHLPEEEERKLRRMLLSEEYKEYVQAEENNDLVNIAEELADMIYIIYGTACSYGIPLDEVIREIHDANMKKLGPDGKPSYREDGKLLKPAGWVKADIRQLINKYNQKAA